MFRFRHPRMKKPLARVISMPSKPLNLMLFRLLRFRRLRCAVSCELRLLCTEIIRFEWYLLLFSHCSVFYIQFARMYGLWTFSVHSVDACDDIIFFTSTIQQGYYLRLANHRVFLLIFFSLNLFFFFWVGFLE